MPAAFLAGTQHDNIAVLLQMGGCFASPSAVLVGWFGMAQGKVPPHKKRQQQNAAAIERCYPIHPCHHLFASVFLAYVVWERQHGLAALPLAECAMLGKTCLRMRFRKQSLLREAKNLPSGLSLSGIGRCFDKLSMTKTTHPKGKKQLCTAQRSPFPRRATSYFGFGPMPKAHFN